MKNTVPKSTNASTLSFHINQALVGLDFEETDDHILHYFDFFRKILPVKSAHFLHVLPAMNMWNTKFEKEIAELTGGEDWKKEVIQQIQKQVSKAIMDPALLNYSLEEGDPLEQLLNKSEDIQADLMVVGKSNRKDYDPVLTKNLIRKAKANSLIIPRYSQTQLDTILVPVDFSKYSQKALETALQIKKQLNHQVKIIALHVYSMPVVTTYRTSPTNLNLQEIVEADIHDAFTSFIQQFEKGEEQITLALICKKNQGIANQIMEFANDNNVNFMVMGAKGHSKVHLLLMGSIAEKLISINQFFPSLIIK